MNTILNDYSTPFNSLAFDKVDQNDFLPALEVAIKEARINIEKIKQSEASYVNTVEGLIYADDAVSKVTSTFYAIKGAHTNDELDIMAEEFSPKITAFYNEISLDQTIFEKVKAVYDLRESLDLNTQKMTTLTKMFKSFSRNGALLNDADKESLKKIDQRLSELGVSFSNNVLKETNDFQMHLTSKDDIAGLPDGFAQYLASEAKAKDKEGWLVTLQYPSLIPFLKYSSRRDLREKLAIASSMKAYRGNDHDNREVVKEIASLRIKRANLLGYKTHADYVLEERMAKEPAKVREFLNDLLEKARPAAEKEFAEIKEYAKKLDGVDDFKSFDYAYYREKLLKEKFNVDDEALKPYFKVENVIEGIFTVAQKMYGLSFEKRTDIPVYHPDVMTYEVKDGSGEHVALFYADYYARESKRGGAWANSFKEQFVKEGIDHRPHVVNVCNFTKPTADKPSLLTAQEVLTLFHEFGHGLHMMLTKCENPNISGANVFWDFVELPSQILENWFFEKDCLDLFAKHYETGELIPAELVQNLKNSSSFHEGLATCRQLSFAMMDMAWHEKTELNVDDVAEFERAAMKPAQILPTNKEGCMSTSFGHIFAGGYSAGYYSYKWAEVLDADAFEYFKEEGLFNKEVADKFRENVLERGGSEDPMELYKRFRGREPKVDALLTRAGLT